MLAAAAAAAAPAAPSAPTVVVDEHAMASEIAAENKAAEAKAAEAKAAEAKPVEAMTQAKPESPSAEGKRMTIEAEEALASKITQPKPKPNPNP